MKTIVAKKEHKTMKTDNELIAEFMGGRREESKIMQGGCFYFFDQWPERVFDLSDDNGLAYHKSWDWLMPVVEKINKIYEGSILEDREGQWSFEKILNTRVNCELELLHKAVVEFIKWYRTQNTNEPIV
jgi:hypothetical protein